MPDDITAIAKLARPLPDKLDMLRESSLAAGPRNKTLIAWAAAHPLLTSRSDWFARAWWGAAAGELVRDYLYDPSRRAMAIALVDQVESQPLIEALAKGSGVIVVTAHIGPAKFLMNWLIDQDLPLLVWTNTRDLPAWLASSSRVRFADPRKPDRKSVVLINSAIHLRRKGVLLGAADMPTGDRIVTISRLGFNREFSIGMPTLSRKLGVPAVVAHALWRGNKIAIKCSPLAPPDDSLAESEWVAQWLERSWAFVEPEFIESPENLRFLRASVERINNPWEASTG